MAQFSPLRQRMPIFFQQTLDFVPEMPQIGAGVPACKLLNRTRFLA
jgi:hypothetical protein